MSTPTDFAPMDNGAAIRLIAGREISTRLRSKVFRIVTLVLVIVVVALCVILKFIHSSGGGGDAVGYVGNDATAKTVATALPTVADRVGQQVHVVAVPDVATGRDQVDSGKLDGLLSVSGGKITVTVKKNIDNGLQTAVNQLAVQTALSQQIIQLGGDPAKVLATAAGATVTVHALSPPTQYNTQQLVLGILTGVLIYISLILNGQTVAQGVVEEKSSRVVELLLATVRPWQLMTGKVLGIGIVGLIQIMVIAVVGVGAGIATKVLTISVSAAASTVVWLIAWYLLGFFMYSIVFAGLGALVSRQEDVGGVVAPATLFLVAGYVLGVSILPSDPGSQLIAVMSIIPTFAPTLMPMRLAMGGVPVWQTVVSVGLVVALIPLLIWLTARIYRNAVLRTGARVKLSQALRAA